MLKTADVVSALSLSDTPAKYDILSMRRRSNQAAFRLDPPRGNKPQYAIAILTAILENSYVSEQIQLISEHDAPNVKRALLMEMTLAEALSRQVPSVVQSWTPTVTPLNVKTCRQLGRSPTGQALPKYQKKLKKKNEALQLVASKFKKRILDSIFCACNKLHSILVYLFYG